MKAVIITHFSNEEVREHLPQSALKADNWIRALAGQKSSRYQKDFAPWITLLLREFELRSDVELHVIAPYMGLKKDICEFEHKGIYYHFYNTELFSYYLESLMLWMQKDFMTLEYKKNRRVVKQFIDRIKPDVINLLGAENPYYACSVLDIDNIPILSTCQTVYTNPERKKSENVSRRRWEMEEKVFKHIRYFGVSCELYDRLIKKSNSEAINLKTKLPSSIIPDLSNVSKEYDFVNFAANHCFKKGSQDCIRALAIVKEKHPQIKLNIVGGCTPIIKKELLQLIHDLKLNENVTFSEYFPNHVELFSHLKKSRFAVLPVKLDDIPGTVSQSMKLGLPIVTNRTSGTPLLNEKKECVLLSEINNIQELAENMIRLMDSSQLADSLRENAKEYYDLNYDNTMMVSQLIDIYKAIKDHFNDKIAIPSNLLFK